MTNPCFYYARSLLYDSIHCISIKKVNFEWMYLVISLLSLTELNLRNLYQKYTKLFSLRKQVLNIINEYYV